MRVLLAEPSAPVAAAVRRFLDGVADVQLVAHLEAAVEALRLHPPDVVMAAVSARFDGELFAAHARKVAPLAGVVLLYPADEACADELAYRAGADAFLAGPLRRLMVLGTLASVLQLGTLKQRVRVLEAEVVRLKGAAMAAPPPAPAPKPRGANIHDEAFFKKYLLLEVKRSRRYQYPSAVLVVAIDGLEQRLDRTAEPDKVRARVKAEVLDNLGDVVRDIDVAVHFGADKALVFLPHTPRQGALTVAERAVAKLRGLKALPEATASVGVAAYDPKLAPRAKVSFGLLMSGATAALRAAQAAGGNRVVAVPVEGGGKRDRISIG
jgi:diguanylate cyclase (GGDEF)-like protein